MSKDYFSLAIDESSDIHGDAYLAVSVRFIDEDEIINKLIALKPLGESKKGSDIF